MIKGRIQATRQGCVLWVLGACCAYALGAELTPQSAAARYQQERAACLSGQSHQDRDTCLKEAGAAFAQARQGGLYDSNTSFELNALRRCTVLPEPDRAACVARMQGQGVTSGSVAGGGIYREILTIEPAPPPVKPAVTVPAVPVK